MSTQNDQPLAGKAAVVTGASRGLGQRTAVALARQGASVALIARGEAQLAETAQEIAAIGGRTITISADVSDPASINGVKRRVLQELGQPTILINSAGIFGPIQLIKDSDPQQWIHTIMINTVSAYLMTQAFLAGMIEKGWGRIISFTSAAALHPPGPINSAYGTSKVALNQFTRHLAAEIAGTGVTANVLHPGDVRTEMWAYIRDTAEAMGSEADAYKQWVRWVDETGGDDPEKAADVVLKLMRDSAKDVNGQFLWIDEPLQAPIPSWGETQDDRPWRG
jgi:NAD(P)-dependent dehydrogenase (short-subunit alcohol dehydrogenase family)